MKIKRQYITKIEIKLKHSLNKQITYKETIIIDKKTNTLVHKKKLNDLKIKTKYQNASAVGDILKQIRIVDFANIRKNTYKSKIYKVKMWTNLGIKFKFTSSYDKKHLPINWAQFMESIDNFTEMHNNLSELIDSSIYGTAMENPTDYIYCKVVFGENDFDEYGKTYYYLADTNDYVKDDYVLVPVGKYNNQIIAKIVAVEYYSKDQVPYPLYKIKHIIRKIE